LTCPFAPYSAMNQFLSTTNGINVVCLFNMSVWYLLNNTSSHYDATTSTNTHWQNYIDDWQWGAVKLTQAVCFNGKMHIFHWQVSAITSVCLAAIMSHHA